MICRVPREKIFSIYPMNQIFGKILKASVSGLLGVAAAGIANGETINWGDAYLDVLRDSYGNPLDNSYYFQLGFFENAFIPSEGNTSGWNSHWKVFDQASFDPATGYFTSTSQIRADGTSTSSYAELGLNFAGQQAFVWARNTADTEWFLSTNATWVFPPAVNNCCDNTLPVEWAISDLDSGNSVPVWGRQGDEIGSGSYTVTDNYTLQTYTVVPEPSSVILLPFAASVMLLRRRRTS